jgi:hypothetical protein
MWILTFIWFLGQGIADLYVHSPIRLHGIVLSKAQGQLYFLFLYSYYVTDNEYLKVELDHTLLLN